MAEAAYTYDFDPHAAPEGQAVRQPARSETDHAGDDTVGGNAEPSRSRHLSGARRDAGLRGPGDGTGRGAAQDALGFIGFQRPDRHRAADAFPGEKHLRPVAGVSAGQVAPEGDRPADAQIQPDGQHRRRQQCRKVGLPALAQERFAHLAGTLVDKRQIDTYNQKIDTQLDQPLGLIASRGNIGCHDLDPARVAFLDQIHKRWKHRIPAS